LRAEFAGAETCRQITAVNRIEVDLLNSIGLPSVTMLGTIRAPAPTPAKFTERAGLLFVAAIHQPDSPNLDALNWYADEILPALAAEMDEPPVLNVVGYAAPEIDFSRFAGHPSIKILGPAGDLTPFYNAARVFVAPTRFAAGTPYKLYETASHGLPCVAGDLLARQLGWAPGQDLLAPPLGDAKIFASQIALLYRTETLWTRLRENGLARIAAENGAARFNATVAEVLQKAGRAPAPPASSSQIARQRRAAGKPVPVGE
jgi:glycosyltransferase involved in cell wall biosynthesis